MINMFIINTEKVTDKDNSFAWNLKRDELLKFLRFYILNPMQSINNFS